MESVRIWSFSGLSFPTFGLNTERLGAGILSSEMLVLLLILCHPISSPTYFDMSLTL